MMNQNQAAAAAYAFMNSLRMGGVLQAGGNNIGAQTTNDFLQNFVAQFAGRPLGINGGMPIDSSMTQPPPQMFRSQFNMSVPPPMMSNYMSAPPAAAAAAHLGSMQPPGQGAPPVLPLMGLTTEPSRHMFNAPSFQSANITVSVDPRREAKSYCSSETNESVPSHESQQDFTAQSSPPGSADNVSFQTNKFNEDLQNSEDGVSLKRDSKRVALNSSSENSITEKEGKKSKHHKRTKSEKANDTQATKTKKKMGTAAAAIETVTSTAEETLSKKALAKREVGTFRSPLPCGVEDRVSGSGYDRLPNHSAYHRSPNNTSYNRPPNKYNSAYNRPPNSNSGFRQSLPTQEGKGPRGFASRGRQQSQQAVSSLLDMPRLMPATIAPSVMPNDFPPVLTADVGARQDGGGHEMEGSLKDMFMTIDPTASPFC